LQENIEKAHWRLINRTLNVPVPDFEPWVIQTEIIDTHGKRCQYRNRIRLWVCKDQQDGFMHSFMHFAPQLAGD